MWTNDTSPRLYARAQDPDPGALVDMTFTVKDVDTGQTIHTATVNDRPNGLAGYVDVPANKLTAGRAYRFYVASHDGMEANAPTNSASYYFNIDATAPAAPHILSTTYPSDGEWHGDVGVAGTFSLSLTAADSSITGFEWELNKTPVPTKKQTSTDGQHASVTVTPDKPGRQILQAMTVDVAGNRSPAVSYVFYVGRGGLTSPTEGTEVVRRVRLAVEGEPDLDHVQFQWRRGPDATDIQQISNSLLTQADGTVFSHNWTAIEDLDGYATWDAESSLGQVTGPVQVRAVMATDDTGANRYDGPWVTVTVSPDAQNAATDSIGPGSVNLLTGDFTLGSTDVDEFGLTIGRTASSRNPQAGLEPQAELLTASQQAMSALTNVQSVRANISIATDRFHTENNSLKILPNGQSADSYAYPGPTGGDIGLKAGRNYRASAWIHVPTATGLNPPNSRALQMVAMNTTAAGGSAAYTIAASPKATVVGAWEQLTFDFTVPTNATTAFIRLYNGFQAVDKAVYFDDLSIREIFAPLGPQWTFGTSDEITGTAYSHISQPYPNVATVYLSGGGEIWFTGAAGDTIWWPQPGAESLTLSRVNATTWRLTELDGTVSEFVQQQNPKKFELVKTSPPAATGQTRLLYEKDGLGRLRLARMIAPIEPGVDNWPDNAAACTTAVPAVGCEVLQLKYATTTTATSSAPGDFQYRLVAVEAISSEDGATPIPVEVVRYAYNPQGLLEQVWDPRITTPLKTTYQYDTDGRVTELTPPGEFGWRFRYGTGGTAVTVGGVDLLDRSSGRLHSVSRNSVQQGTTNGVGVENTSTVVYSVPLTQNVGGPHNMDPATLATWDQRSAPTDATAIFGAEETVQPPTTATQSTPGANGYQRAVVHYLDSSGREVNTATPTGSNTPLGYIDTAEYDQYGNVIRELSAGNRLLALREVNGSDPDPELDALNLRNAATSVRAAALSTYSTYGQEGLDLRQTRGPLLQLVVGTSTTPQLVHEVTRYDYDEGRPDGVDYHLLTTQRDGLLAAGAAPDAALLDETISRQGYNPIDGESPIGPTSGWKVGSPTTVTVDAAPGGANQTASIRYDAQGRAIESRRPGSTGSDAGSTRAAYYTAGPNTDRPECGDKPEWAGLPCTNWVAGDVTGHGNAPMATTLPVRTVTDYSRYGSVEQVTESATGPVGGVSVTQTRTTTTDYDAADRVESTLITATGTGTTAVPMPRIVNTYDADTGHITVITADDQIAGTVDPTVEKDFDALGQMTRYADADGGVTETEFDRYGKPLKVTDRLGTTELATTTFTYDRQLEPRGFVTAVNDSVAGGITATYGPDGEILTQTLPGGVRLTIGYDANRSPISRQYVRVSDGAPLAASAVLENAAGEWVSHTTTASDKNYVYDSLHHLTEVRDTVAGNCTTRKYAYNSRAGRTSLQTVTAGDDNCLDPGAPGLPGVHTVGYAYDSADRLVSDTDASLAGVSWAYDPLGRIISAPVRCDGCGTVTNAYYANDLIASQTINEVARQTWNLDPLGRFSSYTNQAWASGGDGNPGWQEAVTKVNHYDSDSDSPTWIAEDASLPDEITRYVDGLDGNLAVQTGKTGGRVLQLIDLHGDVMTTLPIQDSEPVVDAEAYWDGLRHQAADEFGNPTDVLTGAPVIGDGSTPDKDDRYGWLGGKQRSADALAGVLLMGVRLYDPAIGRFWSPDPVPGGNATAYDYCSGDPVNCSDLDGQWGWFKSLVKKVAKKVAQVAEVVATVVPGPIGAAAAAVSAGAYAATGNKAKAFEMGVTAVAAMIPGGGAIARAGFAAARAAGRVAAKVGQKLSRAVRGCSNSFTPDTPVLMADGSTVPISEIRVGDLVASRDVATDQGSVEPVLNVIRGYGSKHLIRVTTAAIGPNSENGHARNGQTRDSWIATANHPVWVQGRGWIDAVDLKPGDRTTDPTGTFRDVAAVVDLGLLENQAVFNLTTANSHTFFVGAANEGALVHNSSCGVISPHLVRFSQSSASRSFRNGGSVDDMAAGLRSGRIKPGDVPAVRLVQRRGKLYSLDNRRLGAFKEANVMMPYRMATRREIAFEWGRKFNPRKGGWSIRWRR